MNGVKAVVRGAPPLVVIDLAGEVTTFADEAINDAYRRATAAGASAILLNFTDVDYLNSAGISIIIGVLTETRRADQRLLLTGLTPHHRKVFEMTGVTRYAPVVDSEADARAALNSATGARVDDPRAET